MAQTRLTIIVAATKSNGIGQNSRLPWRLPKEMKYFARTTTTAPEGSMNAVIMGRNTWESIPRKFRPLPRRLNVVTSRNPDYSVESTPDTPTSLVHDLTSAIARATNLDRSPIHRIFIIGGASLYTESLKLNPLGSAFVDRILLTRIISPSFEQCDVFIPSFLDGSSKGSKEGKWERASHDALETWVGFKVPEGVQEEEGVQYEYQMWVRHP